MINTWYNLTIFYFSSAIDFSKYLVISLLNKFTKKKMVRLEQDRLSDYLYKYQQHGPQIFLPPVCHDCTLVFLLYTGYMSFIYVMACYHTLYWQWIVVFESQCCPCHHFFSSLSSYLVLQFVLTILKLTVMMWSVFQCWNYAVLLYVNPFQLFLSHALVK